MGDSHGVGGPSKKRTNVEYREKVGQHPLLPEQHGNYHRYYGIRRDVQSGSSKHNGTERVDRRVDAITKFVDEEIQRRGLPRRCRERMLDIGCNSGIVTAQLASSLRDRPSSIIGVDIDSHLVRRAKITLRNAGFEHFQDTSKASKEAKDVLGKGRIAGNTRRHEPRKRVVIERAIARILHADWAMVDRAHAKANGDFSSAADVAQLLEADAAGYDLITALSVAKWIHIDHGDDGLRRFFARIATHLRPDGGVLIIEIQPYKSYKHTLKVTAPDSVARQNYYALRVLPDDFAWILTVELGLLGPFTIRRAGVDGYSREIEAYVQPPAEEVPDRCKERRKQLLALDCDPIKEIRAANQDTIPWVPRHRDGFVY